MHARLSMYQGTSETIERALAQADEVGPVVRGMDGSRGLIYLVDRASGKSVSITLWESEEAMTASEEAANRLRKDTTDSAGETILSVDRFEVTHFDVADAG